MSEGNVRFLAQVFAEQGRLLSTYARIEGMKAANTHRVSCGDSISYNEEAFAAVAELIDEYVKKREGFVIEPDAGQGDTNE